MDATTRRPALPAEMTVCCVGELHAQWLTWLAETPGAGDAALSVDAAAVEEVDAAGVQLLLALQRALAQRQRGLRLTDPSPALVSACAALGVATLTAATTAATEAAR